MWQKGVAVLPGPESEQELLLPSTYSVLVAADAAGTDSATAPTPVTTATAQRILQAVILSPHLALRVVVVRNRGLRQWHDSVSGRSSFAVQGRSRVCIKSP
jgi:hypothetical protein